MPKCRRCKSDTVNTVSCARCPNFEYCSRTCMKQDGAGHSPNCVFSKLVSPSNDSEQEEVEVPPFAPTGTELVRYIDETNLQRLLLFQICAQWLQFSKFIRYEAELHHRHVVTSLFEVPAFWPSCLGGSKSTLLAEVYWKYDLEEHVGAEGVYRIIDIYGKKTDLYVLDDVKNFEPPGELWMAKMVTKQRKSSKWFDQNEIKEGDFLLIRGVFWTEFPNGVLAIVAEADGDIVLIPRMWVTNSYMKTELMELMGMFRQLLSALEEVTQGYDPGK